MECKDLNYPKVPWPAGCMLLLDTPEIDKAFTPEADLKAGLIRDVVLGCNDKQCIPFDALTGQPLSTANP